MAAHSLGAALDIVEADENNLDNEQALESQADAPGDLDGRDQEGCARRIQRFRRNCEPSQ
jgi:hypothetical protein